MNNVEAERGRPVFREIVGLPAYVVAPHPRHNSEFESASAWARAATACVDRFHPRSSDHRPLTVARVLHDDHALHVRFDVSDRYVRCVHNTFQDRVSRDSCVEFFVEPAGATGYFNFEVNAGGTLLVFFIEDPTPGEGAAIFKRYTPLPLNIAAGVIIDHSLPTRIEPEIGEPVEWSIALSIPANVLEAYAPGCWSRRDRPWRCNFFKCGDDTSHPHWAAWADIGSTLRFHQPDRFGTMTFARN